MPLVVPGLQSKDGNQDDWMSKLMGKKLGEQSDEMVRSRQPTTSYRLACPVYPLACPCQASLGDRVLTLSRPSPRQTFPRSTAS
jgi:hypothetical protein